MQNTLNRIENILYNHSAFSFAEDKLNSIKAQYKKQSYYEYMSSMFSGVDNPRIEQCENNALRQFISEYGKYCELYSGFKRCGSVFVLDNQNKVVFFIYKHDAKNISLATHYNPENYDCIEMSMTTSRFDEHIAHGTFDLSTIESDVINECNVLIQNK